MLTQLSTGVSGRPPHSVQDPSYTAPSGSPASAQAERQDAGGDAGAAGGDDGSRAIHTRLRQPCRARPRPSEMSDRRSAARCRAGWREPGMWPLRMPARGSGASPVKRPAARASRTSSAVCSHCASTSPMPRRRVARKSGRNVGGSRQRWFARSRPAGPRAAISAGRHPAPRQRHGRTDPSATSRAPPTQAPSGRRTPRAMRWTRRMRSISFANRPGVGTMCGRSVSGSATTSMSK